MKGQVKARLESKRVEEDFKQAGFVVNIEKSVWLHRNKSSLALTLI